VVGAAAQLARLMFPVRHRNFQDRARFGENLLLAAAAQGSTQALLDLAAASFGPTMSPSIRDQMTNERLPYRQMLRDCAKSDGPHAIEAMVLLGTLLESEGKFDSAQKWFEQAETRSREPSPGCEVYTGPLSHFQQPAHPAATFSHPASRALMHIGRALYEDPIQPLEKSRSYFQRAAEQYDDPTAYSFLARCYETDPWDVRLHNAKKAAASGDKHAASFLGTFYSIQAGEDQFPRNDAHALAEWECLDAPVTSEEKRCLRNPPSVFSQWWEVDGGAARERRSRAIRWLELAGRQGQPKSLAMAAYNAGFAAIQGLYTAESLQGQAPYFDVVDKQTWKRLPLFVQLHNELSESLHNESEGAVDMAVVKAVEKMAQLLPQYERVE
jgi:TPR repeat protein